MNDLQPLPALAAEKLEASTPPVRPMRTFAELGVYAGSGKLRQVHTSHENSAGSSDGVVCEGGKVGQ